MTALFRFEDVTVSVDSTPILSGVSVTIPDGRIAVVAGASGSGKTSLLRLCNRLDVPTAGRVLFRGTDLAEVEPRSHRRRVGMVFQKPVLFPGTVRDNLLAAEPGAAEAEMKDALHQADLETGFLDRIGDDLSGGEAQRVCLARALMCSPEVLLMDEPTASLHPSAVTALEKTTADLYRDRSMGVVWVTHDLDQIRRLAGHLVILENGRVRYDGLPDTPAAQQAMMALAGEET
jgi:putative ABC transport system ATP-binding protein